MIKRNIVLTELEDLHTTMDLALVWGDIVDSEVTVGMPPMDGFIFLLFMAIDTGILTAIIVGET